MKTLSVLLLDYDIFFNDSDEGSCHAGDGCKILRIYEDNDKAIEVANKFNPIFKEAEKEVIVCPIQRFNKVIKKEFGFTTSDIDNGGNFRLSVENFCVE